MEFLKEWTFCVCISLIISVIFSLFSPGGKMNRFYKMLISVFVFLSFIYPLKDFHKSNLNFDFNTSQSVQENTKAYEDMVKNEVENTLKNGGIEDFEVNCSVLVNKNSQLEIENVEVKINKNYSKESVFELINEELGINAKVSYFGE